MKIALFTIWHVYNYGAEMQTYATVKALKLMGHDVEVIDVRLVDGFPKSLKIRIASCISYFSKQNRKFSEFWRENIPSSKRYRSLEEIRRDSPNADIYLVGSDQVWNPMLTGGLSNVFFLDFGNTSIPKISYASSFGCTELSQSFINDYGQSLSRFSHISCRELSGVGLLKKHLNIDAATVLDPTLLHQDYSELTGSMNEQDTLVFYPVSGNVEDINKFSQELAKSQNLIFINANKRDSLFGKITWDCLTIPDWLRTLGQAKFVVTTSFHGLAFSILFHRQFVAIGVNKSRNTRITNLLSQLGLLDRYYEDLETLKQNKPWENKINYSEVDEKLRVLRDDSFSFLKNAIK
jgi:hypothetical protein